MRVNLTLQPRPAILLQLPDLPCDDMTGACRGATGATHAGFAYLVIVADRGSTKWSPIASQQNWALKTIFNSAID